MHKSPILPSSLQTRRPSTTTRPSSLLFVALAGLLLGGVGCAEETPPCVTDGTGDGGIDAGCTQASDCPGSDTECGVRTCHQGVCGMLALKQEGVDLASQLYGDCRTARCDASGGVVHVTDLGDTYDDGNACTLDTCIDGETVHANQAAGFACGAGGAECNGGGQCVYCNVGVAGECSAGYTCVATRNYVDAEIVAHANNKCVPGSCLDGIKNGSETDVDCGGSACAPCAEGKSCAAGLDCASASCDRSGVDATHLCLAPTCWDGSTNGAETGPDYGGPDCPPIQSGWSGFWCRVHSDCASGVCQGAECAAPTCFDAVRNGDETGVDCGGSCVAACLDP